jgi:hypothetical protein
MPWTTCVALALAQETQRKLDALRRAYSSAFNNPADGRFHCHARAKAKMPQHEIVSAKAKTPQKKTTTILDIIKSETSSEFRATAPVGSATGVNAVADR